MKVLAVSPNYWGKGSTIAEAKRQLRKVGGDPKRCSLYSVPDDYTIDEMGRGCGSAPAVLIEGKDFRD